VSGRLIHWLGLAFLGLAQASGGLGGIWSLDRVASEFPKELGFSIDTSAATEPGQQPAQPGGGRRRGGGNARVAGAPFVRRESYEDAQRLRLITDEVRTPPTRLVIVDNLTAVTITNELGQSRTFHPSGREESVDVEGIPVPVTTVRDGERLVVTYHVEQGRDIRYSYSSTGGEPARLTVQTQFLENGDGDKVTRVYDAGTTVAAAPGADSAGGPAVPADGSGAGLDQRPGAEFKGLKDVGLLVEDLGSEALACGLKRESLEDALTKKLTAGGLNVRRNSDEDTYVYINIVTETTPPGSCTTRFDAFLYTHAPAKLSYREQPVLVQVSLMHRGGLGTSGVASHAAAVTRGLESYVDLFLTQIHDANK